MYKVIFIDLDGTLRDNNKNISKRTSKAINEVSKRGILVVICTGRPQKYTEKISRECNASRYIITSSGANIYDYESNKIMYIKGMNKEACINLYNIAIKSDVRFSMNVGDRIVTNRLKYFDGSEIELSEDIVSFVEKNNIFQCNIADKAFDKMKDVVPLIEKVPNCEIKNRHKSLLDSTYPKIGDIYCDVSDHNTCKGNAVKKLCELLDISLEDTIAIGDDCNDISMFEVVNYSVAMGNANDEIKKYAAEVTKSNEEDGVACFLEKLIKKIDKEVF